MRIRLLAFASAGDALGSRELELELPAGATVADLRARLATSHPGLAPLWGRLAVAVDQELAGEATPLADGVEVALLPPVSGGTGEPPADSRPRLMEGPIDAATAIAAVAAPSRGAVVLFLGTVRDHHAGRPVAAITYHAYRPMAERRLRRLETEVAATCPHAAVAIVHRLGPIGAGEASVAIAVAAPHRAGAYAASRTALERLKREIPIWKQERYADGEQRWREEEPLGEGVDRRAGSASAGSDRRVSPASRAPAARRRSQAR